MNYGNEQGNIGKDAANASDKACIMPLKRVLKTLRMESMTIDQFVLVAGKQRMGQTGATGR